MFKVSNNSSMNKMKINSLSECERALRRGETKWCVGLVEDMIDFATLILDHNVVARTTENINGSKTNVMVGKVKRVRVYEACLLDPKSKTKIYHGVAIFHLDTTACSPIHGAFFAIGSGLG
ncbi:hypothetical protein RIF29_10730 [Crotalaria pallida]|uniref:BURP domain-containing protein n=1 Tax=Crotalaria pallida TaxID=3830 RepID=A0AAN9FVI1_CROPI